MAFHTALVVDFDNTLGDSRTLEVTQAVKRAVIDLVSRGVRVAIVTGKPFSGRIKDACHDLGLIGPQIVHNGAEIIDPTSGTVLWSRYLRDDIATSLIDRLSEAGIFLAVEQGQEVYTTGGTSVSFYGSGITFQSVADIKIASVAKIMAPATMNELSEERVNELVSDLRQAYPEATTVKGQISGRFGLDITDAQATKYEALIQYMQLIGLRSEEVVGVGDGYNDIGLLSACGTKVAMEDAPSELKALADLIVPTQKHDGLLTAIADYFPPTT